ncbi:hypothetical protein XENTR_v10014534 [Xenopus tropicalis]|nr:hypothetical protein XENTR_v10014534 [Xenopus tropicalis]
MHYIIKIKFRHQRRNRSKFGFQFVIVCNNFITSSWEGFSGSQTLSIKSNFQCQNLLYKCSKFESCHVQIGYRLLPILLPINVILVASQLESCHGHMWVTHKEQ